MLYFDNLSPDTTDAYLAEGLTEEMIARLGGIDRLTVSSRTATQRFRGRMAGNPAALGRALGVAHLVSGSVRRSGTRLRVTVELVRAATGTRVWGEQYDRSDADLLAIETNIATAVATAIAGRLLPGQRASLAARPTNNPGAYDSYLRGNHDLAVRSAPATARAIRQYEAAARLDSTFARAFARAAFGYALFPAFPWPHPSLPSDSLLARSAVAVDRALQIDSSCSDAWMVRAFLLYLSTDAGFDRIQDGFERAVALDPKNDEAWQLYGIAARGFDEDSVVRYAMERALGLEPQRPVTLARLAELDWIQGRYASARRLLDSAIAIDPEFYLAYWNRALLRLDTGEPSAARSDAETALRLSAADPLADLALALVEAATGDTAHARARMRAFWRVGRDSMHPSALDAGYAAQVYVALGEDDRALTVLEGVRERRSRLHYMLRFPTFDAVRATPRFRRLFAVALAIRAEGDEAARAALDAARIFEEVGRAGDAARAYSAAVQSRPGCHPARRALALLAMERGDAAAAANHLAAVDPDEVPFADRVDFARLKARALSAAGRDAEAAGAWEQVFRADPSDEEAFGTLGPPARQAGRLEEWLALAARHDAALAATGNATRRRDLRCERALVLSDMGRLEAAEGAWRAALEIDPDHQPARQALAALAQRSQDWGKVAEDLAAEAARAEDPAEAAALLLRRGRLLLEKLSDPAAAALALEEAAARARSAPSLQAAIRASREAERLLVSVLPTLDRRAEAAALAARLQRAGVDDPEVRALATEAPPQAEAPPPAEAPVEPAVAQRGTGEDAVAEILREQAEAAQGEERVTLFERLAGHLERSGNRSAAADALLEALAIDPARDLTFAWFLALAEGDRGRLAAGHRLRALAATDAAARSQALGDLGRLLTGAPETAAEGVQQLERALALDPSNLAAAEDLARAHLDLGRAELAVPLLEKLGGGGPTLSGEAVAGLLAEARRAAGTAPRGLPRERDQARAAPSDPGKQEVWAAAAEAAGELPEAADAWEAALQAEPEAAPEDMVRRLRGRARAVHALGRAAEALDIEERALALLPQGPGRAPLLADLAERAEALGDPERALRLADLARAADPLHGPTLAVVCRLRSAAGDLPGLAEAAGELEAAMGPEAVAPFSAQLGRLHAENGEWEQAYARLRLARLADPQDAAVAQDLARAAEKLGHLEEAVSLAELAADALASYDPLAAAARFRQCGEIWRDRLSDPERAAVMLEKALSLVPQDRDTSRQLLVLWAARPETAPRALDGWLELARRNPADAGALSAAAEVCRQMSRTARDPTLLGRAAAAEALSRFASPGQGPGQPAPQARRLSPEIRQRSAAPGAWGPTGQLLALLSPHLERLFPADLARRGVGPVDRLGPAQVPSLHARVESASRVLGARPVALFLAQRGGVEIALENTQPVAMVVGARALDSLSPGALSFLVARALELLRSGWALVGKFAPRDVGILCELACRFAGGQPPSLGLPEQRAGAFLSALATGVPATIRDQAAALGKASADELRTLDPRSLVAALRRSANRSALLFGGDPQAALEALARREKEVAGADGVVDPSKALAVPDLRDLALFALSDLYLELRGAVVG